MNKIAVFFEPDICKENKSFSPSANKPKLVIKDWNTLFADNIDLHTFEPLKKEQFYLVHDQTYVDNVFNGTIANGFGMKDGNFASTFCYTSGSLYHAAHYALDNDVAVSPTSGFHHARYNKSEGFCTFNGLVLTATLLKGEAHEVGILDFDMHYGNGTDEIIKKCNINNIVHYTAGKYYDLHYPLLNFVKPIIKYFYNKMFSNKSKNHETPKPVLRQKILKNKGNKFLKQIPDILNKFKNCDIIIYQAGADQHINDPYGGLLTYEQMQQRDKMVFQFAKTNNIPIVWNLAGGYQKDSQGTIEPVLKCHRITMEECIKVFR